MKFRLIVKMLAGTLLAAGGQAVATPTVWDADLNPVNGFGGITSAWGLADAGSAYAEWRIFESTSDSSPDVGSFGMGSIAVTETTGTAFLTGGGNIYSYAAAASFVVPATPADALVSASTRTVALRIATVGTAVDDSLVRLDGVAPSYGGRTYLEEISGGYGGNEEEWLFVWEGVGPRATYQIVFNASEASMSLDQVAFYASPPAVAVTAEIAVDTSASSLNPGYVGATGGANDVIRVVVLGADTGVGDAADIDVFGIAPETLRFGPDGAAIKAGTTRQRVNHDNDGLDDMRFRFLTEETGIACTDTEVALTGILADGTHFTGVDTDFEAECDTQCH